MSDVTLPRLLGISGSLRKASNNTALLHGIQSAISSVAVLHIFSLADIPMYNGDHDGEAAPKAVTDLKTAISEADGLVIASPEYNYGVPGVLKNALDWASRPAYESSLKGKPVLLLTSSPGYLGGVRAQSQLRDTFSATLSRVVAHPHVALPAIHQKLIEGSLAEDTLAIALAGVHSLLAEISLIQSAPTRQ